MKRLFVIVGAVAVSLAAGCALWEGSHRVRPPSGITPRDYRLMTTAYCACQECCGWKRNWYGKPVIAAGPLKGKPKAVGITASGAEARRGTIAADTRIFPFGTVMYIPGYGYGVVQDRGGAIKGYHIDLYHHTHRQALDWGRQIKDVKVWFPPESRR